MPDLYLNIAGQGQPLVLLHGWGWHSEVFEPLVPLLSERYQLFLIDLPGYGQTPNISDYSLKELSLLLLKNLPPKANWVGWSLGGLLALSIAIHFPDRVNKLITVASSPRFIQENSWPGIQSSTFDQFYNLLATDRQKTIRDFLELQLRGSPKKEELFQHFEKKHSASHTNSEFVLQKGLGLLRETDLRGELKKMTCPNLHIFGQLDTIVPVEVAKHMTLLSPNSQCEIIKRTGHIPFLSHQEDFVSLLDQFLR